MSTLVTAIVLLAMPVTLVLYGMYFASLLHFGKTFQRLHPSLFVQLVGPRQPSFLTSSRTYRLFRSVQAGKDLGEPLSAELLAAYGKTRRRLFAGLLSFMVLLFSLLALDFLL